MLNFLCFFILFNAVKTDTKLTLHHISIYLLILPDALAGNSFIISLTKIKLKNLEGYIFFKNVFTIKEVWDGLPIFAQ